MSGSATARLEDGYLPATSIAWAFSAMFALAAALAYVPNPVLGPDALFITNGAHNLVHLLTAIGFGLVAMKGDRASVVFMKSFGVVYLLVGVVGFAVLGSAPEGRLLGLVHINQMDNVLHVGLAAMILGAGFIVAGRRSAA